MSRLARCQTASISEIAIPIPRLFKLYCLLPCCRHSTAPRRPDRDVVENSTERITKSRNSSLALDAIVRFTDEENQTYTHLYHLIIPSTTCSSVNLIQLDFYQIRQRFDFLLWPVYSQLFNARPQERKRDVDKRLLDRKR